MKTSLLFIYAFSLIIISHSQTVKKHNKQGIKFYYQENYEGAIAEFTKAVKLDSTSVDAYFYRGNAKELLKDYTGAIEDFTKAIQYDNEFIDAYYNRGKVKMNLN